MSDSEGKGMVNSLQAYIGELLELARGRKLVILGCTSASAYICCAIRAMGGDVDFFLDPEADPLQMTDEKSFMNRPALPLHRLIYEDPSEIAVVHSLHYRRDLNRALVNYGLRENESYFGLHGYQSAKECDVFDPLVGYGRSDDSGSFHVHGEDEEGLLRVVAVGGATTDYSYSGFRSWPSYLHEILLQNGIPNVVFNGGVNGYTSCEERDVVLRDVPCLKPDLVLSLSGACDIADIMIDRAHPWYSRAASHRFESVLRAHNHKQKDLWFDEVGKGAWPGKGRPDSQNWLANQRIMYASLKSYGIAFHGFLQPAIFAGNYQLSEFERQCMASFTTEGAREIDSISVFFDEGKRFYKDVRERMVEHAFLHDLSDAFDGACGAYSDWTHYEEVGNRMIAQAVYGILVDAGLQGKVLPERK